MALLYIAARFASVYDIAMIGVFLMIIGDLCGTGGVLEAARNENNNVCYVPADMTYPE